MSRSNLGASLNHTFHVSSRLLTALIQHSKALFPKLVLTRYVPPLKAGATLPSTSEDIQKELEKQESLLNQIHMEMNCGCIIKQREELLWEVQRIITQLKVCNSRIPNNISSLCIYIFSEEDEEFSKREGSCNTT